MKLSRTKFNKLIKNYTDWEKLLTKKELSIINLWLLGLTYPQIGHIYNVSKTCIQHKISGDFNGKGGIYAKLVGRTYLQKRR